MHSGVQSRKVRYSSFSRSSWLARCLSCPQRSEADGVEGLCMILKQMSFPCCYSDMIYRFRQPAPILSMVTNQVEEYIYQAQGHKLTQWNNLLLNPATPQRYAVAIARKGAPLENCSGFVFTVRPICRPNENQSTVYNGHKRVHALKFQSLTTPNGLIAKQPFCICLHFFTKYITELYFALNCEHFKKH